MTAQKLLAAKNLDNTMNSQEPASFSHQKDSRSQRAPHQPEPLIMGGLSQIGEHQYAQLENKQRKQQEYKRMLEN